MAEAPVAIRFRAMNTDVEARGVGPGAHQRLQGVPVLFADIEQDLSRFRPDSQLSIVNRQPGRWLVVSHRFYDVVTAALAAAAATAGTFDPTVLDALEAAGYDRSFPEIKATEAGPAPRLRHAWRQIGLEPRLSAVFLPTGVRLDLGGIGKGWAVDAAFAALSDLSAAAVDAGGDLRVRSAPGGPPWTIAVQHPLDPQRNLGELQLRCGAVATSSTLGRRWGPDGHHLIDPVTGQPCRTDVVAAAVVADSAVLAEVLAKAAVIRGAEQGLALLEAKRCAGILVGEQGDIWLTRGLGRYFDAA